MLNKNSAILGLQWNVYASYSIQDTQVIATDESVKSVWELSDESIHPKALKSWISIDSENDLMQWISTYGFLFEPCESFRFVRAGQTGRLPVICGPKGAYTGKPGIRVSTLMEDVLKMRSLWNLYKTAVTNPYELERIVFPFIDSNGFPGKKYKRSYYSPDGEDVEPTIEMEDVLPEEWQKMALANMSAFKQGVNPFVQQAAQISKDYTDSMKSPVPMNFSDPDWTVVQIDLPSICGYRSISMPTTEWVCDPVKAAQFASLRVISRHLSEMMRNFVIQAIVSTGEEVSIISGTMIENPQQAIKLAFFKELTQSSILERCPHPTCGKMFLKSRKDKSSCGDERCQKFVTKERRKERQKSNSEQAK